ncbi:RagB/SusD family nutrient uptake outer membrane protein [Dysgonomonas sp. BGC7]|uniref:RagB/SusD family nutrient uptake outer membrane protein n=1 Tax=Dysgonomonas sp. BGC7 TaxID=1658008 RepID=UPI00067FDE7F|nr:RagB/SusD family nutrient uptake outer membrane protein [Dysgonomonas sp. BGC7]MBD8388385.1 RagB/SusD family nutrient uptake outer membrane protein [Dysgonomonas sp. BGC7]
MKKLYSNLILTFAVSLSLFQVACDDFLDLSPTNAIPSTIAITNKETANAAIIGAYNSVQNYYSSYYITLGTITADNVSYNGTLSQYLQLDQNSISPDNIGTVTVYQTIYSAINSANSIIAAIGSVNDPLFTTPEKNKILGEAYFIRALSYFDLARGWGGVQIQQNPTKDLSTLSGIKRSTLQQTYDRVLEDLIKAEELLPEDDTTTRNRAQKNAARALRARLHLYREQWTEAEQYATLVIGSSKYSLVKPFNTFFSSPFLSRESVFELTFTSNDKNSYWNLWYPSTVGGQYTLKPSETLVTQLNNPNIGGTRKSLIAGSGNSVYGVLYNTVSTSTDPAYVIRIAELYLIRAEARAKKSATDLPGALSDLKEVRDRADVPKFDSDNKEAVILAIENENSIEFAFEPHRWFDLVRTKRVGAVLGLTNTDYWLFPLPASDILSDPDVDQNPGY